MLIYSSKAAFLYQGDCIEVLKTCPDNFVDAVVCDPPYGLRFMGKEWDDAGDGPAQQEWHRRWAEQAFRVLKPGGHLVAFGGTRTYHRLACALEDAGFEIRDSLMWLYGTGFPKSLDVGKALDKKGRASSEDLEIFRTALEAARKARGLSRAEVSAAVVGSRSGACWNWETGLRVPLGENWNALVRVLGLPESMAGLRDAAERAVLGRGESGLGKNAPAFEGGYKADYALTAAATDLAKQWDGWGTALKPAHEPIVMARKPLVGTVAENVTKFGTGALNIDGCRIETTESLNGGAYSTGVRPNGLPGDDAKRNAGVFKGGVERPIAGQFKQPTGRWPANVMLDEEAGAMLGGASRFFYSAKTSTAERNAGCENLPDRTAEETVDRDPDTVGARSPRAGASVMLCAKCEKNIDGGRAAQPCTDGGAHEPVPGEKRPVTKNHHPTVKPVALMTWLVRLVTPPGGLVLDPFAGSGTTGIACVKAGFRFVGIEREPEYVAVAAARIAHAERG